MKIEAESYAEMAQMEELKGALCLSIIMNQENMPSN